MARPGHAAERAIDELGLTSCCALFVGDYVGGQDLRTMLHASWDFEQLNHRYEQFLARFRPELDSLRTGGEVEPRRGFVTYLDVVNTWRQLAYRDPGLPAEVFDET